MSISSIKLQLGDIIEIASPSDDELNNKQFFIAYIDNKNIDLISKEGDKFTIYINEDGTLRNESIIEIGLLSRAEQPSYALQNKLLPNQWIDIFLYGDIPSVMTGQIIELDEDQIGIKLIEGGIIYIDFGYKGIPKDIPIDKIVLRNAPGDNPDKKPIALEQIDEADEADEIEYQEPEFRERVKDILLSADQIQFGDKLGVVSMAVEVPEEERRYGIDKQLSDLLNDLLSDIPNTQRTQSVLNNIHRMLERFKQLRDEFSLFDVNGNASMPIVKGSEFKPLIHSLQQLNHKLHWIIPIVKNRKKLYDIDEDVQGLYSDVIPQTIASVRTEESEFIQTFKEGKVPDGQNGYDYLVKKINDYWTPFESPINPTENIFNVNVKTNITAIVDNLEDFYSSIALEDDVKRKRFLIQEYNLGMNTIETQRIKGGGNILKHKIITQPDTISIKSFLTLPESTVTFSHINLPSTHILSKCNLSLHYLAYWKFLNHHTKVNVHDVNENTTFDDTHFLKGINEYLPENEKNTYESYLNKIIPKTRILFNLTKKNIIGKLSLHEVVGFLEPFMIYTRDVSFKQYEEIVGFVSDKIKEWKINYITKKKEYDNLPKTKTENASILDLFKGKQTLDTIIEQYGLNKIPITKYTNSELLNYFNTIDHSSYFKVAIGNMTSELMIPSEPLKWIDEYTENETQQNCVKRVLSKKYIDADELELDNHSEIKYDTKYDTTRYDIIQEYYDELDLIDNSQKIKVLSLRLQENKNMTPNDADREAEAMLLGYRPVKEGDYAILELESEDGLNYFYVRKNDIWVRDETIPETTNADSNSIFCNLSEKCIYIDDKCNAMSKAGLDIQKNIFDKMISEFDESLISNVEKIDEYIDNATQNAQSRAIHRLQLLNRTLLKHDFEQHTYGLDAKEVLEEKSPFSNTLALILSQSDFVKKQSDIVKFVSYYTRPPVSDENQWWLYCNVSGIKLLPSFVSKLAEAFVKGTNYFNALQLIMSQQGNLGGDGEAVIDKYSGWVITNIDFNTDEGYTDEGFIIRTREIMEADLGNAIAQAPKETPKTFEDPETEKIVRVMKAISRTLGLNVDSIEDFVIGESAKLLSRSMPSKIDYEEAIAKIKKKKETYEIVYDQTLICITASFLLIGIQTNKNAMLFKTKKTFPGCVKSFTGYPTFGDGDKTGIIYIGCVIEGIKSSIEPWNALRTLNSKKIVSKMEGIINKFILPSDMMQELIKSKADYDATNKEEFIPEVHDIMNWINFLPPLRPVDVSVLPPSKEFQDKLVSDIKKGDKNQFAGIDAIRSKMIFMTLSIELSIQKIISKNIAENEVILSNNARVPFLENACCNDSNQSTFDYFNSRNPSIEQENNIIRDLRYVLDDIDSMSKAPILFDPSDTRIIYSSPSNEFNEETIYKAFIHYCNYNTDSPLPDEIRAICVKKPDSYTSTMSMDEKIKVLKSEGIQFDHDMLARLMNTVHNHNRVVSLSKSFIFSNVQKIHDKLETIREEPIGIFPKLFIEKMILTIQEFNLPDSASEKVRDMKNYLSKTNDFMMSEISKFVTQHLNTKVRDSFIQCLSKIDTFKSNENPEFSMIHYMKNTLDLIVRVYPNMIINEVTYDNIKVPAHWELSEIHQKDIKNHASEHFKPLAQFYGDGEIKKIMEIFQIEAMDLLFVASNTLYITPIVVNEKVVQSIFDARMVQLLFKFYVLNTFTFLIDLRNRDEFYVKKTERPTNPMLDMLTVPQMDESIPSQEIMMGDKKNMSDKISKIITSVMTICCANKNMIDMDYFELTDKVTRSKEKEKDKIVEYLTEMTDEEREIENMFKNFRIGRWSVGMQKGYRQYEGETYDQERGEIEKRTIIEAKLKRMDGVTEGLMDVFALDAIIEEAQANSIEEEELHIDYNGEDDNLSDDDYDNEM